MALIVAVTLFREGVPTGFRLGGITHWSGDGLRLLSRDPLGGSQFVLNIVLFVPAGVAWTRILKRPLAVVLALGGVSLVIESIQAVTDAGAPDVADLVANSVGAGIGVAVAAIVHTVSATHDRRMTLRSQLRVAFEGTDRSSIEVMLESEPERVFGATTYFADGTRYSDDVLEIRYPATFFSLHRCVYVVWNSTGVDFRKASGRDCTDFIDG